MMQETVNKTLRVLKRGLIDSKRRRYYPSLSGVNRTSRMVEVGAHIYRLKTGDTGKPGTVQESLELNRNPI